MESACGLLGGGCRCLVVCVQEGSRQPAWSNPSPVSTDESFMKAGFPSRSRGASFSCKVDFVFQYPFPFLPVSASFWNMKSMVVCLVLFCFLIVSPKDCAFLASIVTPCNEFDKWNLRRLLVVDLEIHCGVECSVWAGMYLCLCVRVCMYVSVCLCTYTCTHDLYKTHGSYPDVLVFIAM